MSKLNRGNKTCDWCGELEPDAGSFKRTGERTWDTVLCPDCCPDDDVERGSFIVATFTMDREDNRIAENISEYIEKRNLNLDWKLVQDSGAKANTDGHTRCKLVLHTPDGLTHYKLDDVRHMKAVIDSSTGDPERNNARFKIYNYDVAEVSTRADEPEIIAQSE